jgi:branched-chain amino acid transport system ATP-binding protein
MPDAAAVLEVDELAASYGPVRALDGVSLSVAAGSITAVLGANGAGKTSLLRAISGLLRPRRGRVRLSGEDIVELPVEQIVRRGVSHVPEGRGMIGELTVEENLRLGALWRRDGSEAAKSLQEMYDLFPPLRERRRRAASTLSGGERQMLSIGRALMGRPQVLLLDEPSLGLAPLVTREVFRVVEELNANEGVALLIVEQNAAIALDLAHRAYVLETGRVATSGTADELRANDSIRAAYLGY